jgi:hypothetical protein
METSFNFILPAVGRRNKEIATVRWEVAGEEHDERCSAGGSHDWQSVSHMWVVEDLEPVAIFSSDEHPIPRSRTFAGRRCRKCGLEIESYEDWE